MSKATKTDTERVRAGAGLWDSDTQTPHLFRMHHWNSVCVQGTASMEIRHVSASSRTSQAYRPASNSSAGPGSEQSPPGMAPGGNKEAGEMLRAAPLGVSPRCRSTVLGISPQPPQVSRQRDMGLPRDMRDTGLRRRRCHGAEAA